MDSDHDLAQLEDLPAFAELPDRRFPLPPLGRMDATRYKAP
jgi:hypothetical protein